MKKLVIGLFFGGKSPEHEISIITANQVLNTLDRNKYEVIPVYVSKMGDFYLNSKFNDIKNFKDLDYLLLSSTKVNIERNNGILGLSKTGIFRKFIPIDIAFPLFHGLLGEDGSIQGLFEILKVPYVGFDVQSSAIGIDKNFFKFLLKGIGLPTTEFIDIKRFDWLKNSERVINITTSKLKFPMFVKPATLGSSIGVNKVSDRDSLMFAIEVAFTYSEKVIVEKALEDIKEVNCSVLGYKNPKASVCEMPISKGVILSFSDKYQSSGFKKTGMASTSRIVPAPIRNEILKKIQSASIEIFKRIGGCGVARIDFFVDEKNNQFFVNEINTIPGSLSYYLWEKSGIKFKDLLDNLISFALEREDERRKTQYTFESNILSGIESTGTKT